MTGVSARLFDHPRADPQEAGKSREVASFLAPSATPPIVPTIPVRPCDRPTLIGRVLVRSLTVRALPSVRSPAIATFHRTNTEGATQVFDLQPPIRDAAGDVWYRALLPLRPNDTWGYVAAGAVRVVQTTYRLQVDRKHLRLTLWDGCVAAMKFPIGLGKESTPTPNGRYYVIALLKPPLAQSVYGAYAYGLSAFSDVLTNWAGGGIIGLHGTNDPASIGDRQSHGCIRMYNRDIKKLVPLLPLGTPIDIG